jgi:hypothetical protein
VLPPAGPAVDDPPVAAADVPVENDELDGSDEVGTLSGSVPVLVSVWAWAAVIMPRKMIALRIMRCIAFSRLESDRRAFGPAMQDNARSIERENEVSERFRGNRAHDLQEFLGDIRHGLPRGRDSKGGWHAITDRAKASAPGAVAVAAKCNGKRCARIRRRPVRRSSKRSLLCSRR